MKLKDSATLALALVSVLASSFAWAGFVDERTEKEKAAELGQRTPQVAASVAPAASAAAKAVPAAGATQEPVKTWEVLASDVLLMKTFQRWAKDAGYTLRWDAEKNFLVSGPNTWTGSFEYAVFKTLMTPGIRYSDYPLEACVYPNKPLLMRVTRKGEQARDCPSVAIPEEAGLTSAKN
ncbi:TcpQ domain-containing protein [Pelomonas sp. APW6]|uniref:TcpQ domain-containing protein n=1 Tax=Roseateles subflavus TaxID=3053353 RepID=A0ABT7LNE4_9BURK|nr:TcpQ domain-containing protein [Pelomonas sp. APW6]MDL5034353.1 TcpQ domain-containing protein [Pelomonas sp. APW6]